MYRNKFVGCVRVGGQILREFGDSVRVPFGSEYELYFRNLENRKVKVSVSIDGTDVLEGRSLIIDPNSTAELTRFIKNGNLTSGNRFKFIEKTGKIQAHRGNKIEDGLIRIEFEYEMEFPKYEPPVRITLPRDPWPKRPYAPVDPYNPPITYTAGADDDRLMGVAGTLRGFQAKCMSGSVGSANAAAASSYATLNSAASVNDSGITVAGSQSNQEFNTVFGFVGCGTKEVMVIRLIGDIGQEESVPVTTPITVRTKIRCETCGELNLATNNFCTDCGTSLRAY